jgi:hypothetical protein
MHYTLYLWKGLSSPLRTINNFICQCISVAACKLIAFLLYHLVLCKNSASILLITSELFSHCLILVLIYSLVLVPSLSHWSNFFFIGSEFGFKLLELSPCFKVICIPLLMGTSDFRYYCLWVPLIFTTPVFNIFSSIVSLTRKFHLVLVLVLKGFASFRSWAPLIFKVICILLLMGTSDFCFSCFYSLLLVLK